MPIEPKRGCGYRKVGGLYLIGTGMALPCDGLPLEIKNCPVCGYRIPFTRGFMWVRKEYIAYYSKEKHISNGNCSCHYNCPICHPEANNLEKYGFMWVGENFYKTPDDFILEAEKLGVSKRISSIPKDLQLNKTWVLLAHRKVPFKVKTFGPLQSEPLYKPAIFYAFKPIRIEKLIWQSQATEETLEKLRQQGISPVIVPDDDIVHKPVVREK
jgi:hypothetical protein